MFGTKIASRVIQAELLTLPEVIAIGTAKVVGLPVLPQGAGALPGLAFYPEFTAYTGAMGSKTSYERLRFVIKAMCEGTSTGPIDAVALAQLAHFDGLTVDVTLDGTNYQLTFSPNSEVLPTTVVDGDRFYRQLGTVYDIELT